MRVIRLRRRDWAIAVIGAFALAAAFLGYGAVSAAGDPPAAPASLKAERHDGSIEIILHPPERGQHRRLAGPGQSRRHAVGRLV